MFFYSHTIHPTYDISHTPFLLLTDGKIITDDGRVMVDAMFVSEGSRLGDVDTLVLAVFADLVDACSIRDAVVSREEHITILLVRDRVVESLQEDFNNLQV